MSLPIILFALSLGSCGMLRRFQDADKRLEKRLEKGYVVSGNGRIHNYPNFARFVEAHQQGKPGKVTVINYHFCTGAHTYHIRSNGQRITVFERYWDRYGRWHIAHIPIPLVPRPRTRFSFHRGDSFITSDSYHSEPKYPFRLGRIPEVVALSRANKPPVYIIGWHDTQGGMLRYNVGEYQSSQKGVIWLDSDE